MIMTYILSPEADDDLDQIFDYTEKEFGYKQAVIYLSECEIQFNKLANNPTIGRERPEIRPELYSFPYQSHIIFYRIMQDHIRIVRVIHGSRDIPKQFTQ